MPTKPLRILILILLLLLALAGCKKAPHAAAVSSSPQTPPGVKSTPLKIELTAIPAGFRPVAGAVDPIRLTSADGGEITIARGTSTDLAAAARNEEARLGGLPQGRSLGSIELLCQFGRALLTRGLYRDEGGTETEEIRISLVAARPLVLAYRYPAAGSRRQRLDQALAVLRSLQPVT
ncbi:MAG TPA: hypothetical protein VH988_32285 [Thermoanaerobaculia bacterium]|jgi:hypothetical protein|nr:hypothetical protein [Thermoanaerobaculia bacterium]